MAYYIDGLGNQLMSTRKTLTLEETQAEIDKISCSKEVLYCIVWYEGGYNEEMFLFKKERLPVVLSFVQNFECFEQVIPYYDAEKEMIVIAQIDRDGEGFLEDVNQYQAWMAKATGNGSLY